ncbi:MAG: hypothetical protein DMD36_19510, partial [Gemmatimonadetes bacterium]
MKSRAAVLLALPLAAGGPSFGRQTPPEALRDPAVVASHNGVLELTLTAARGPVQVGGRRVIAEAFNGSYFPPTLRVRPGDAVRLRLVNELEETTNLHMHGLSVSPLGNADNVFLHVAPGGAQDYEIRIPATHAPGLYWYHPHPHGRSDEQVRNGMSGALIVEGLLDPFPELRVLHEHVLLLKDAQIGNGEIVHRGIGDDAVRTVNGMLNPTITLRPGETQLWRIGNVGADLYYLLTLDGHRFYEVARDGHRLARLVPKRQLLLEPGAREEVLVQAAGPGTYALRTAGFDTGPQGNHYPGAVLATVRVEGAAVPPLALPKKLLPVAGVLRIGRRRHVLRGRPHLRPEPHRHARQARRDRRMDHPERVRRAARLPHPPDALSGDRGEPRPPTVRRLSGHRQRPRARRGEGGHPIHRPGHRREVRV